MIPISRLALVLAVALSIVFVSLWFYFRAGERARLADEWERERPPLPEHTHVETGLRAYEPGLRRKLILGVYIVPLTLVIAVSAILNSL